jgi:pilus assembly protein Flp/PilA
MSGSHPRGYTHMLNLYCKLQALWATRDRGATAVEYGLIVAAIAAVIVVTVITLGTKVEDAFKTVCGKLSGGTGTC